jgi:hypothetical protein
VNNPSANEGISSNTPRNTGNGGGNNPQLPLIVIVPIRRRLFNWVIRKSKTIIGLIFRRRG